MKPNHDQIGIAPFVSNHQTISRRRFLRGAGIVLSLPLLDAMTPVFGAVAKRLAADATPGGKPRRFFGICNNLGLLPEHFFLVPGVGAQGGDVPTVCENAMNADGGILINVSRAIIFAGNDADFAKRAGEAAADYQEHMAAYL